MAWQDPPPPPVTCQVCGVVFTVSSQARNPKYCTRACQIKASTAIRSQRRRERREVAERTPDTREMPPMPWLVQYGGLCSDPRTIRRAGYPWTSDDPAERALARRICKSCEISLICLEWSIAGVAPTDTTIYGGAGHFTRNRIRRSRRRPAQPGPQAPEAPPQTATA